MTDYRAKAHEFGHYALVSTNEYLFSYYLCLRARFRSAAAFHPIFHYGFLDRPYEHYWA